jgi:hypothetical protein
MSDAQNDPRYAHMSEMGQGELSVYLDWIKGANLADTEYAFVTYVMGRAQMKDPRHLFNIWLHQMGQNVDRQVKSQIRRFFMNPSDQVSFASVQSAGWFDFIPWVYQLVTTVPAPTIMHPTFVKVGSSDLPY